MKEEVKQSRKICPRCKREYAKEDRYCSDDGAPLEIINTDWNPKKFWETSSVEV